jgi:hypothetical protein
MNLFRAILMFAVGVFALYQGWVIHTGNRAMLSYGLGALAVAIGVWRLMRKPDKPLV